MLKIVIQENFSKMKNSLWIHIDKLHCISETVDLSEPTCRNKIMQPYKESKVESFGN